MSTYKTYIRELSNLANQCDDQEAQSILRSGAEKIKALIPPQVSISPEAQSVISQLAKKKKR